MVNIIVHLNCSIQNFIKKEIKNLNISQNNLESDIKINYIGS